MAQLKLNCARTKTLSIDVRNALLAQSSTWQERQGGLWEDEVLSALCFQHGSSCSLNKKFGLGLLEVCELSRVALRDHSSVTRIVATPSHVEEALPCLRSWFVRRPHEGLVGGIYQGGNGFTRGQAEHQRFTSTRQKGWHSRNVADHDCRGNDWWGTTRRNKQGMRKEARPGKYRYLMPLDTEMRKRVEPLAQPYPSAGSADSGTVGDQSARGGATPTSALLTNEETCREDQHQHPQT